jgi:adenylate kinase
MKDIVLIGMQGSGKGTQGDLLMDKYGFSKFESGANLRSMSAQDTDLGKLIKSLIDKGSFIPDDLILEIFKYYLLNAPTDKPIIYDGMPRNIDQYTHFNEILSNLERDYVVLYLHIGEEEALRRLNTRKICKNCGRSYPSSYEKDVCEKCNFPLTIRADDTNKDAVLKRISIYRDQTLPIIELYKKEGKLMEINGERSIEEVYKDVEQALLSAGVL